VGTDPSSGMVAQARAATPVGEFPNIGYKEAVAENLTGIEDGSVDMVVAGQAAHWFDYPRLWPELRRVLRPDGTMAFWGYTDHVFVDYPKATELLHRCCYSKDKEDLGHYWSFPGRAIVEGRLKDILPPEHDWSDITRIEYEPDTRGPRSGNGTIFLHKWMTIETCKEFVRTWSAYHGWQQAYPQQKPRVQGGQGDVVDRLFDQMVEAEAWKVDDPEFKFEMEWGTGLLMARRARTI
jgi:trans-aconitate 3-methyltransferase